LKPQANITLTAWVLVGGVEGEQRRLKWRYRVDRLHIPIWNTTKKPLAIALSGAEKGLRGRDDGGIVNNVQYKPNWNCHYQSILYNEYIVIKILKKKQKIIPGFY
jgi:hypothetical protein